MGDVTKWQLGSPGSAEQQKAFRSVRDVIERIRKTPIIQELSPATVAFIRPPDRGVRLSGDVAERYMSVLQGLTEAFAPRDPPGHLSPRAVEARLQQAVFDALGDEEQGAGARTPEFALRLDGAVRTLAAALLAPPTLWTVRVPVCGPNLKSLPPFRFGRVCFKAPTPRALHELTDAMERFQPPPGRFTAEQEAAQRKTRARDARRIREEFSKETIAELQVEAIDQEAARLRAADELQRTVDVLNFFALFLAPTYDRSCVWLAPDRPPSGLWCVAESGTNVHSSLVFNYRGPFRVPNARERSRAGMGRGHRLLCTPSPTSLDRRILTAAAWAGRAYRQERSDQAFLFNMVALECLLTKKGSRGETTERLRLRGAHLVGRTADVRERVYSVLGGLYRIRGALVHEGEASRVTDQDLGTLRTLVQVALWRVLTRKPFIAMKSERDLDEWFDARVLGSR